MRWMVTLTFNNPPVAELQALLPAERAHVQELMEQGIIENIYIAGNSSKVWLVMTGESAAAVEEELNKFPLRKYFEPEPVQINPATR